jgi:hypothetical protein
MRARRIAIALGTVLLTSFVRIFPAGATPSTTPSCPDERTVLVPVAGRAYHTAYFSKVGAETGYTTDRIRWFERSTRRQLAGVYLSNHWGRAGEVEIRYPAAKLRLIWRSGAVPMVRMMPWSALWRGGRDPAITMQRIVDGRFDGPLRRWFRDARASRIPLLIEFGVEVNGEWFPWNGRWNGAGASDGYGDPELPDGPERFRDAYRHVIRLSRQVGADRLTWNFHVDADGWPKTWWNQPRWYYPGDRWIDWLSVSDYGEQVPTGNPARWNGFADKLGDPSDPTSSYWQVRALDPMAPFAVIEFGVTEDPAAGDKAAWIAEAYDLLTGLGATYDADLVSYWSERWENFSGAISDLRVHSSPRALAAYRAGIADGFFATSPWFGCVPASWAASATVSSPARGRRSNASRTTPVTEATRPETTNPQRAPNVSPNQPAIGEPIGVDPRKTIP